jgi:hypothetical protein
VLDGHHRIAVALALGQRSVWALVTEVRLNSPAPPAGRQGSPEFFGAGPVIAATIIGDVRQVCRFPSRAQFAAYNGTAPVEVSSCGAWIGWCSWPGPIAAA